MTEKINKINNPLTIIAIFAALAEINATIAISLIDKSLHYIFIWFIIGFPTVLIISFFLTLNFNTKVMYSPSDYKEDKSFMDSLFGNSYGEKNSTKISAELTKLSADLEQKITEKITEKFERKTGDAHLKLTPSDIEKLKIDIKEATDESIKEISEESILKAELKQKMLEYYPHPAFYVLLFAITKAKANSPIELNKYIEKFFVPKFWEKGALSRLIQDSILEGDKKSFNIKKEYVDDLGEWAEENEKVIKYLSYQFQKIEERAEDLDKDKIENRITQMAGKIKF